LGPDGTQGEVAGEKARLSLPAGVPLTPWKVTQVDIELLWAAAGGTLAMEGEKD